MAATFLERVTSTGDYDNDGGALDYNSIYQLMVLFDQNLMTNTEVKALFSCTTLQGDELQEILDTKPDVLASDVERATWAQKIGAIAFAANCHFTGFETASEVRGQLGLD